MKLDISYETNFDNSRILSGVTQTNFDKFPLGFSIFPAKIYSDEEVEEFRNLLATQIGTKRSDLIFQRQTHGTDINVIRSQSDTMQFSDGMITNVRGLVLNVTIADCAAVLIFDANKNAIGAFHSGWRGTAAEISKKGIKLMNELFDCKAEDLICHISSSAGKDVYEVGAEVAELFPREFVKPFGEKYLLDIKGTIHRQLIESGCIESKITVSPNCTISDSRFHSYRRDKDKSGRMSAFIGMI